MANLMLGGEAEALDEGEHLRGEVGLGLEGCRA
jgi:hypothetical protein